MQLGWEHRECAHISTCRLGLVVLSIFIQKYFCASFWAPEGAPMLVCSTNEEQKTVVTYLTLLTKKPALFMTPQTPGHKMVMFTVVFSPTLKCHFLTNETRNQMKTAVFSIAINRPIMLFSLQVPFKRLMHLLQMTLLGLTCWLDRNCANRRMSILAWANSAGSRCDDLELCPASPSPASWPTHKAQWS